MDIDDVVYPLLVASFPDNEPGELLDIVEEFKHPRGLDEHSEFEQEVWQKYLVLRAASQAKPKQAATQRREGAGVGEASDYLLDK
jgi:hypothetical protein